MSNQKSNPPKRGKDKTKEKPVMDISKTAYATPKNKFNLGSGLIQVIFLLGL